MHQLIKYIKNAFVFVYVYKIKICKYIAYFVLFFEQQHTYAFPYIHIYIIYIPYI